MIGVGLPDPEVILEAGGAIEIDFDDLFVSVDFDAQLALIQGRIAVIAALVAELSAQLSTTGLTVWTYSGTAEGLGAAFAQEVLNGIGAGEPGDPTYGLVVAAASPVAWAAWGNIFYTG